MSKRNKDKLDFLAKGKNHLTETEIMHLGTKSGENAFVALKYFDSSHQCFSEWDKSELKAFSDFLRKICQQNWSQIVASGGGSGNKKGLGYTPHKNPNILPNQNLVEKFSEDTSFFELRISQKARVHGFRIKSAFFLLWLDRNHDVYPK